MEGSDAPEALAFTLLWRAAAGIPAACTPAKMKEIQPESVGVTPKRGDRAPISFVLVDG
jgi:hypothetical protein